MRRLNLILPSLIWPEPNNFSYLYQNLELPNFRYIISKSSAFIHNLSYSDFIYPTKFQVTHHDSTAKHYAAAVATQNHSSYLLAEPVHLIPTIDKLFIDPNALHLDKLTAEKIITLINEHFNGEIVSYYINPSLWLIGFNKDLGLAYAPPSIDIIEQNIDPYLISGKEQLYLHKIFNELQMLLFSSSINQTRTQQNLPIINSLWLWDKQPTDLPFNLGKISSNNHRLGNKNFNSQNLAKNLNKFDTIFIDNGYNAIRMHDNNSWQTELEYLDNIFGQELLFLLRNKQIDQLNCWLFTHNAKCVHFCLTRTDLLKFWRSSSLANIFTKFMKG